MVSLFICSMHLLQEGVGDTPDSYAYDGNRIRIWNIQTYNYGQVSIAQCHSDTSLILFYTLHIHCYSYVFDCVVGVAYTLLQLCD